MTSDKVATSIATGTAMNGKDAEMRFAALCDDLYNSTSTELNVRNVIRQLEEAHNLHSNALKREFNEALDALERVIDEQKNNHEVEHMAYVANVNKLETKYQDELNQLTNLHRAQLLRLQAELGSSKSTLPMTESVISQLHDDHRKELERINTYWRQVVENKSRETECVQRKNDELNALHKQNVRVFDATIKEKDEMIHSLEVKVHEMESDVDVMGAAFRDEVRRLIQEHTTAIKQNKMLLRALEGKEDELELILSRLHSLASLPIRQLSLSPFSSSSLLTHQTGMTPEIYNSGTNKTANWATTSKTVEKGCESMSLQPEQMSLSQMENTNVRTLDVQDSNPLLLLEKDTKNMKSELHQLTETFANQIASQLETLHTLQKDKLTRLSVGSIERGSNSSASNSNSFARDNSLLNAFNDILKTTQKYNDERNSHLHDENSNDNSNNNTINTNHFILSNNDVDNTHSAYGEKNKTIGETNLKSTLTSLISCTPYTEPSASYLRSVQSTNINEECKVNESDGNNNNNNHVNNVSTSPLPTAPSRSTLALLELWGLDTNAKSEKSGLSLSEECNQETSTNQKQKQEVNHKVDKQFVNSKQRANEKENVSKSKSRNTDTLKNIETNVSKTTNTPNQKREKVIRRLFNWQEKYIDFELEQKLLAY